MADGAHLIGTTGDVRTIDRPHDAALLELYQLWQAKRGERRLPARAHFDPAEFRRLLANVMLLDILPAPGAHSTRRSTNSTAAASRAAARATTWRRKRW